MIKYKVAQDDKVSSLLAGFTDYDELLDELKEQGFDTSKDMWLADEKGLFDSADNYKDMTLEQVFEFWENGRFDWDENALEAAQAIIDVEGASSLFARVESKGYNWSSEIYVHEGWDWEQFGKYAFDTYETDSGIPENLIKFFDFEKYGESYEGDTAYKYFDGIIEIFD